MSRENCPSVVDLIREHGVKVNLKCSCCERLTLYRIEMKAGDWFACAYCDVDIAHRGVAA